MLVSFGCKIAVNISFPPLLCWCVCRQHSKATFLLFCILDFNSSSKETHLRVSELKCVLWRSFLRAAKHVKACFPVRGLLESTGNQNRYHGNKSSVGPRISRVLSRGVWPTESWNSRKHPKTFFGWTRLGVGMTAGSVVWMCVCAYASTT